MTTVVLEPEVLQEAQRQACAVLKEQLNKFGLSMAPNKDDPDGQAFWNDPTATKALRTYSRAYYLVHQERIIAKTSEWQRNHPIRNRSKAVREARGERSLRWYRANKAKASAAGADWRRNHSDKVLESSRLRRARQRGAEGSFTEEEFGALCIAYDNRCGYCSKSIEEAGPLIRDHMTPLSRGGSDDISNIMPACRRCNSLKYDKTVEEFLSYLEERKEAQ